jgi:hypothetical protein
MPVPQTFADLTPVASTNSPQGTESVKGTIDDYLRAAFALLCQLYNQTLGQSVTLASAATVNIGFAQAININITGTTTITAFDTWAEGTLRWVTFAGALTLTYDATKLQLPGAANILTAAGDVGLFKSLGGGNWKCLDFQRVSGYGVIPALPLTGGPLSGNIIFANAKGIFGYDNAASNPAAHQIVNLGVDNNINFVNGPGGYWRLYNAAASKVVFQSDDNGMISPSGGVALDNGAALKSKDAGGTLRNLTYMAGNTVVNIVAGGTAIQWYNQAGTTAVASLDNSGTFSAITVTNTSDERKKKRWQRLPGDLIERLAGVRRAGIFHWKKSGEACVGIGAQSLEAILPEAVYTDVKGNKTINSSGAALAILADVARELVRTRARLDALECK